MTLLAPIPRSAPWYARLFFSIPLIGWMARDAVYGREDSVYYALIAVLSVWAIAVMQLGIVALYLPMVALTPVCLLVIIGITRG